MLRGVKPVGQGAEGCVDGRGLRRLRQGLFGTEALAPLLVGWVLSPPARSLHAAEPFPPGEASEHFDAQARAGKKDLMATLQADSRFQVMTRAMSAAGMSPMLHARGPLTLFVPTDAAFEKLTADGVKGLAYIPGDHLYGDDTEGATDASHASDLGFMRQADVFEPVLRAALK